MVKPDDYVIVLCTCPDPGTAETIARGLVEGSLAACVNILPGVRSIYRWKGLVESSQEQLLLVKTRRGSYAHVEQAIRDRHPYELPEIIAVPMVAGSSGYLVWINEMVKVT